jgi:hypothetical protein
MEASQCLLGLLTSWPVISAQSMALAAEGLAGALIVRSGWTAASGNDIISDITD